MSEPSRPIDYLAAGVALAIYSASSSGARSSGGIHRMTVADATRRCNQEMDLKISQDWVRAALARLGELGAVNFQEDPYAETLLDTDDTRLKSFFVDCEIPIYRRAHDVGLLWLRTALQREDFWRDIALDDPASTTSVPWVPAADRFVALEHNAEVATELQQAVTTADEQIRASNTIEDEQRSWIRAHLDAGALLIRRGGLILKDALMSLVVQPLRAALKYVIEERGKEAIRAAIQLILSLIR